MTEHSVDRSFEDVLDESLARPDGRVVAWTRSGSVEGGGSRGRHVIRMPGTPGSRWLLRSDRSHWKARGIEMITTERPGYGLSTRRPGYGLREHADDVAAVLDHLGIDRAHVYGLSGGGPHVLALAAFHPDRVIAASVVVGLAPMTDTEVDSMIDLNTKSHRVAEAGDADALREMYEAPASQLGTDPLAGVQAIMEGAPGSDRAVMSDPGWQRGFALAMREAFRQGPDGWVDEDLAFGRDWEVPWEDIRCTVSWWHGREDKNCPRSAAERLVQRIPTARLIDLPGGHLASYTKDADILDELLRRS